MDTLNVKRQGRVNRVQRGSYQFVFVRILVTFSYHQKNRYRPIERRGRFVGLEELLGRLQQSDFAARELRHAALDGNASFLYQCGSSRWILLSQLSHFALRVNIHG